METNYTPGPWNFRAVPADSQDGIMSFWIDSSDGSPLVDIRARRNKKEAEANARLVATAPDLLESLMQLVEQMESQRGDWLNTDSARAAIAKATAR